MCFSATASFAASGVLTAAGVASLKMANKKQRAYAAIPLIFALQQALEGVLWLTTKASTFCNCQITVAYGFLAFAFVLWPIYIPFAVYQMEENQERRKRMRALMWLGGAVSLALINVLIFQPLAISTATYHMGYDIHIPLQLLIGACYLLATCGSMFVSSHRWVRVMGFAATLGLLVTFMVAQSAAVSVWCFFAGVLSILVLAHMARPPVATVPK